MLLLYIGLLVRLPRPQAAESSLNRDGGELWTEVALSPMMRFVTLLAVVDMPEMETVSGEPTTRSSIGDARPPPEEETPLFFPKLSFHLDGFFVTGMGTEGATGTGGTAGAATGGIGLELELLEALLISLASDCEASARVASASSFGEVGGATELPLPFLAPRFLRLVVEVDRDSIPSTSTSCELQVDCSGCSSSSGSWSKTVESSHTSSFSYAGPRDGARESEREGMAGVRMALETPDG